MLRPCIFLDRDGTLNVEKHYLHEAEEWEWIPGAIDAIHAFNRAGYLVVVVTNQAGVARGYYSAANVEQLHRYVEALLSAAGAHVDGYYYCPHHPDHGDISDCDCRKPKPGMLLKAAQELPIDLGRSWMIGDKHIDIEAARAAGVRPILVETGYGAQERASVQGDCPCVADILEASRFILSVESGA